MKDKIPIGGKEWSRRESYRKKGWEKEATNVEWKRVCDYICEFASKLTKHDCNTQLTFYSNLITSKNSWASQILYHFNTSQENRIEEKRRELYENGMHR